MSIILRPYQEKLLQETRVHLRSVKSVLIQAATGAGKTAIGATAFDNAAKRGHRSLFIVHRQELIEQTAITFDKVGIQYGYCAAGYPFNPFMPTLIASIDTLKNRIEKVGPRTFIGWDECHHAAAKGWAAVKAGFPDAYHVGFSATPERLDGRGLNTLFDVMVCGPSVEWLISEGHLCKYRAYAPTSIDLSGVGMLGGDYNKAQLEAVLDGKEIVSDIIGNWQKIAGGKRTVVFCASVKRSVELAERMSLLGIRAASLDGKTDRGERAAVIAAFRRGDIQVLTNVDLFGEGFDLPAMECVVLARPTKSLALHMQQVGRVLRPSPGKTEAIIIDFVGNLAEHGLPDFEREWKLTGRDKTQNAQAQIGVRICSSCFRAQPPGRPTCRYCGAPFPIKPRTLNETTVSVAEVDIDAAKAAKKEEQAKRLREQGMASSLDDLIRIGTARGMKSPEKWAAHIWTHRETVKQARAEAQAQAYRR